jgi:hypothetical protein
VLLLQRSGRIKGSDSEVFKETLSEVDVVRGAKAQGVAASQSKGCTIDFFHFSFFIFHF